ncbi:hypothetical protein LCGC14_1468810 [marine sediment metagenome]|uniref:Uncharacterized protein n=1 Tax=marine sediment metagenome TaxID=412755 RepID=A0A0F9JYV4_9ZZZZ
MQNYFSLEIKAHSFISTGKLSKQKIKIHIMIQSSHQHWILHPLLFFSLNKVSFVSYQLK